MRFVSYSKGKSASYGLLTGDGVLDLPQVAGGALPDTLAEFIAAGPEALRTARRLGEQGNSLTSLKQVRLTAPIPRPVKNVFCVGRNYKEHVAEGYRARGAETKLPEYPQFFTAVIGPDEPSSTTRQSQSSSTTKWNSR